MKNENNELITLKEASEMLKCHPNTLRQWDEKGIFKAVRMGVRGDRKYKKNKVVKFINKSQK